MGVAKKYTYRNKTDNDLTIIGVGFVKAGSTITVSDPVSNPNLALVEDKKTTNKSEQRRTVTQAKKPEDKE